MADREAVRALAAPYLREGRPADWFEPLYASAAGDASIIPWADLRPNLNLVRWLDETGLTGDGRRALDIGCGLGDTTVRIADLVGARGHVHGVDVAERMIDVAMDEASEAGVENVSFESLDVEVTSLGRTFDYAFSRMGTMFFASPVAALRNVREALVPGGLLNMVVWRRKLDNEVMHRAELVVDGYLNEPEDSDAPRCGPGPFSMANADTVTDVLMGAVFVGFRLARQDLPYRIGKNLDDAVAFNMALGPAAGVLRMWGERVDDIRPTIARDLRKALSDFVAEDGSVVAQASTWAVTARAPRDR